MSWRRSASTTKLARVLSGAPRAARHDSRNQRIGENTAHVQLRPGALASNTTYYLQVDHGVFLDGAGAPWSGVSDTTWRFSTKAGPAAGAVSVTVAADGTGDFASIQGAFDFVPVNNTRPITIQVRNGTYREMLLLQNRPFVTLRGEDRRQTVVAYPNNANLNAGNARGMVGIDSNDFTLESLTLRNLTPPGGSQAEALRTNSQRCYISNVDFSSYQDTLFINGRVYFTNCYIEGDVDFIWGGGTRSSIAAKFAPFAAATGCVRTRRHAVGPATRTLRVKRQAL